MVMYKVTLITHGGILGFMNRQAKLILHLISQGGSSCELHHFSSHNFQYLSFHTLEPTKWSDGDQCFCFGDITYLCGHSYSLRIGGNATLVFTFIFPLDWRECHTLVFTVGGRSFAKTKALCGT